MTDIIAHRRYVAPIRGADWSVSAADLISVHLSLALTRHVPGWRGATDEQLTAVATDLLIALDDTALKSK